MNVELVSKIKRIAIIALASDDELVESLVLKGGNAIDLGYRSKESGISRASYDLDYSIEDGDFSEDEDAISKRIEATLVQTFLEYGYVVMDYKFLNKPKKTNADIAGFWGGYKVTFKVIDQKDFDSTNMAKSVRSAIPVNPNMSPTFELEFSKFEYIGEKKAVDVDGFNVYIYTPSMIVFEKLRAICQQIPEYKEIIASFTPRARARDFYDMHMIMEMHHIVASEPDSIEMIRNIFLAKKVPLEFIKKIRDNKAIHEDNWKAVVDTVSANEHLEDFDFYFNFVLDQFEADRKSVV